LEGASSILTIIIYAINTHHHQEVTGFSLACGCNAMSESNNADAGANPSLDATNTKAHGKGTYFFPSSEDREGGPTPAD
jgi:hypothetical protein